MLNKLYLNVLKLAQGRFATVFLSLIAFSESIIFPIPPDTVLIPMALSNRKKAFAFATLTTFFSVLGGAIGYFIGLLFWDSLGQKLTIYLGYTDAYSTFARLYEETGLIIIVIGALTPFPFKIVAILSGLVGYPFFAFILAALLSRGIRFYVIALVIYVWGNQIDAYLRKYSGITFGIIILVIGGAYVVLK